MWLEQKIITFQCEKLPNQINEDLDLNSFYLVLNENKTTIKLPQLFLKLNEWEIDEDKKQIEVKGWSILSVVDIKKSSLTLNEKEIKISFDSEDFGNVSIIDVSNPLFQANDKQLSQEELNSFMDKIFELSEAKKAEDVTEEVGSPHSDPSAFINKKYEFGKARYLMNGYKEFVSGNYRLLLKQKDEKTIPVFFEILSENELKQIIDLEIDSSTRFIYRDEKNNELIEIEIIEDSLNVKKGQLENE